MIELKVLQAVRLKGRINPADIAATVDEDPTAVAEVLKAAAASGFIAEGKTVRVTENGRNRLNELLAAERQTMDHAAVDTAYAEFRDVNADFKALVADWQLKDGEPNTHEDEGYDA